MSQLTEEQRRRIEENRRRAIEKRAAKNNPPPTVVHEVKVNSVPPSLNWQPTKNVNENNTNGASNVVSSKNGTFETYVESDKNLLKNFFKNDTTNCQQSGFPNTTNFTAGNLSNTSKASSSVSNVGSSKNGKIETYVKSDNNLFKNFLKNDTTNCQQNALSNSTNSTAGHVSNISNASPNVNSWQPLKVIKGSCVLLSRKRFYVDVGYHKEMIDVFKSIPSRNYDVKTRKWNFSLEDHNKLITSLKKLQPDVLIGSLPPIVVSTFMKATESIEIKQHDLSNLDPVLLDALLPFQKDGVNFGIQHGGKILIADDMGLGKTIQAIAIADYFKNDWPLLVVTPSSVRYSWQDAFHTWLPSLAHEEITIINSRKDHIPNNKVIMMSYDMLSKMKDAIIKRRFRAVIIDESHFLKNPKSARTKAAQAIMKGLNRIIMLSGTPALSRPIELFTQLSALRPKHFPSYIEYGIRYCNGTMSPFGWDMTGYSNMEEFKLFLEEIVMIRRLKSEVIKQLPSKSRQIIILDPARVSKSKVLRAMSKKMLQVNLKGMERRGALLEYFHETGVVKLPAVTEYISDLLEADRKFLCFAHHQVVMDGICTAVENSKANYIRIDGSTSSEKRKHLCDMFQFNDSYKVAVLSITAANAGITLTAANLVLFAELFWNPGILTQAEDRAHRIGQENSVVVQYLVAKGTADDEIWPLVQRKLDVLNKAGLSKDNFNTADAIQAEYSKQPHLEDFWREIENSLDLMEVPVESPTKRSKLT